MDGQERVSRWGHVASTRDHHADHGFYIDFAAAGRDAIAMVSSLHPICGGTRVKDDNLSGLRVSPTIRHLSCGRSGYQSKGYSAWSWTYLIFNWFAGGDKFSCQVSKSSRAI